MAPVASQPAEPSGDIPSLTSIRGLAAFWVVLVHVHPALPLLLPEAAFLDRFIDAGTFAVPLFFILSGYVLGLRYRSQFRTWNSGQVLRFLWLRIARIYPVHLLTLLASVALATRHGWPDDPGHSVGSLVANLLLVHAWPPHFGLSWNYPSWSISSEWFAYLLFPFLALALARSSRAVVRGLLPAALVLSALVYALESRLPFRGLAVVLPTFAGGVLLSILCPPSQGSGRAGVHAGFGLLAVAAIPYLLPPGPAQAVAFLLLYFFVIRSLGIAGAAAGSFWNARWTVYLGEISYALYLSHGITVTLMDRFLPFKRLETAGLPLRAAALCGFLLAILGAAAALHHGFERPLRELARRRRTPKATVPST
jgi:peptidoglycan/LPS O-acetylase OafA/YrhL